ncbi:hypothetical protein D3C73_1432000 [compost metagenome]
MLQFQVERLGRGHLQQQCLDQQQAARHQRVALERHGQGEDEFQHQQPTGGYRADGPQHQGIEQQKANDGELVPARRVAEEIVRERLGH